MFVIRKYENGEYNVKGGDPLPIITRHPNIVKSVLLGKKGWGLWKDEWGQGIGEGLFTKDEIFSLFREKQIIIPESFLNELNNKIWDVREKFKFF